jgi:diguanylate cyclase (GGDEF)-like protein
MSDEPRDALRPTTAALRSRFRLERKRATRTSVLAGGLVAMVGLPAWSLFDYLVAPDHAWDFTVLRLIATGAIAISWALVFTPLGRTRPELLGLAIVAAVEIAIAAMIVQLDGELAAYGLGMSLAIYACAFLLMWPLRYTLALIGIVAVALTVGWLLVPDPPTASNVATVCFYVFTAAAIAVVGQIVRERAAWREFQTRVELEAEQRRSSELVDKLDKLSYEDPLTGLGNRRAWEDAIARAGAGVRRADGERTLSVLLCDVDCLKDVNDTLGHSMGDIVLRAVAELLRGRIRAADMVARIGGDEFAVLAMDSNELEAATLAEDLRGLVASTEPGGPSLDPVTVSIGVAEWDGGTDSPETLMMRADRRLYAAKARRNVVCAGDPVEPAAE